MEIDSNIKRKQNFKILCVLHLMLMIMSLGGICSKMASAETFLSPKWCLFYGGVIVTLAIYALGWQQVIKRMPLTAAYANKAVTTIWGMVWGTLFFGERISIAKIVGVVLIVTGVVLFATADKEEVH